MKIRCHRPTLAVAFQIVSGAVPSRTSKDVLQNIKVQVADGRMTLLATDHDVGIRYEIDGVESDSAGEFLLPNQRTAAILRELPDDHINLETAERTVKLSGVNADFQLGSENPDEFPTVATFDDDAFFVLEARELRKMIRRTVFAADVESTRYALGGVLWDQEENRLTLAATDSKRLAVIEGQCELRGELPEQPPQPVIPVKAMHLLDRCLTDEGEVHVSIHSNHAMIRSAQTTIYCRLVEGRFPRYRDVIPKDAAYIIPLVAAPLLSTVRQAQIVINEDSRGVEFSFAADQLTVLSQSSESGSSEIGLPISYDGPQISVILEPRFLADFLKVVDPSAAISLHLTDQDHAVALTTEDRYSYVVMPLTKDRRP